MVTAWLIGSAAVGAGGAAAAPAEPGSPVTTRVSVSSGGAQVGAESRHPAISRHGRYVAFASHASGLVPGDTNGHGDVFVRDRKTNVTRRVSISTDGTQANLNSFSPAISANGRYVAFASFASNLVAGDSNQLADVFVRDRVAHVTTRVSVGPGGAQADGGSYVPAISADGRYVAFASRASNLVPGDSAPALKNVFVRDRVAKVTSRVSMGPGGTQPNSESSNPAISAHGRYIAFVTEAFDVFVRDRVAEVTTRVSLGPGDTQANGPSLQPAISAHGRYVAFASYASNLVTGDTNGVSDVFLRDRRDDVTTRVSVGPGDTQTPRGIRSLHPTISAHGRYVAFQTFASNLVAGDTNGANDVFLRDRRDDVTTRVSVGSGGTQGNNSSSLPVISAHGRYVAFESRASNLVAGDTNGVRDVFVRDRGTS